MEWQPIETAPKNRQVLVSDGYEVAYSVLGKAAHVPIYGWIELVGVDPYDADVLEMEPTHWMPLPEPPRAALGEEGEYDENR